MHVRSGKKMPRRAAEQPAVPSDRHAPSRNTTTPEDLLAPGHGREADAPQDIPPRGWRDILIRTWKEFQDDRIPLVSAGVTFYVLLSLFPALGAFVALYGLFADVADAQRHLQVLAFVLPGDGLRFLGEQMVRMAAAGEGGLSLAFATGLLLSIWSANGAMKAVFTALNVAYDEAETRTFLAKTLTPLAFTLGFLAFAFGGIFAVAAPAAVEPVLGAATARMLRWLTWPVLIVLLGLGLALLYRFGPSRNPARWRWVSWGSGAAVLLWLAMSAGFSVYLANFANYDKTYGPLGAAVGFMMWVYLSTQVILLGAELNSEIEHQTARDTTVGPPQPLGERGAVMADTVGKSQ